jgi:5-methylcytosine-specific restriction endonuclease McrA
MPKGFKKDGSYAGNVFKIGNKGFWLGKKRLNMTKENNPAWKGGVTKLKNYATNYKKEYRHRMRISKKYISDCNISKTKEYKRLNNQAYRSRIKIAGKLSIKTVQQVYEDNIKQYRTLTCYLCLKPIEFGKDHLEHKTPLFRGGTNVRNNLGIACQFCNCSKHTKTEEEYRKEKKSNV